MKILALDAATRTGYAIGDAGTMPFSNSVRLKKPHEETTKAWSNIGHFLVDDIFRFGVPGMIAIEAALHPNHQKSGDAAAMAIGIAAVVTFVAAKYDIPIQYCGSQTVAKHFIGKGNYKSEEKKLRTLARAKLLGYLPDDCKDFDRADACAVFDYAAARWGGVRPKEIVLYSDPRAGV